jgi:hypothetical protein
MYGGRVYHCKRCGYRGAFVIKWDEGATCPDLEPALGSRESDETQKSRIPLWVKAIALIFLLYLLFMRI